MPTPPPPPTWRPRIEVIAPPGAANLAGFWERLQELDGMFPVPSGHTYVEVRASPCRLLMRTRGQLTVRMPEELAA
jgi:hypothetical protein